MSKEPLLDITLRNGFRVFAVRDGYSVIATDRRGRQYEERVSSELADWLGERLAGKRVSAKEAADVLARAPLMLRVPYSDGG